MPKRGAFALGLTAVALALLLNFQTPTDVPLVAGRPVGPGTGSGVGTGDGGAGLSGGGANGGASGLGNGPSNGGTNGSSSGSANGAGSSGGSTSDTSGGQTVTGPTVDTRYGPVQVSVTVRGHQVLDVTALQLPAEGRSGRISQFVEPILRSEVLQAQGANIDGVSGATFTSLAYAQSLQAALDSAGS
jgi:uncharacterized protein with FMN-binding domain